MLFLEMEPGLTVDDLRSQGLLTLETAEELEHWFQASCSSPEPLELPEALYRMLVHATYLAQIDPETATRH